MTNVEISENTVTNVLTCPTDKLVVLKKGMLVLVRVGENASGGDGGVGRGWEWWWWGEGEDGSGGGGGFNIIFHSGLNYNSYKFQNYSHL